MLLNIQLITHNDMTVRNLATMCVTQYSFLK